jgi:tryptophanyl-tRNA synthetase
MSKSYGNAIDIFGVEKDLRKIVMSIKMDSRAPAEPKPDAGENLAIQLLKVMDAGTGREYEGKLGAGGLGYGDLKKKLFEVYWEYFAAARARRAGLAADLDYVNGVLRDGAARAHAVAQGVLRRARKASGLE